MYEWRTKIQTGTDLMIEYNIRKAEIKIVKGLLDLVILGLLKEEPIHGYSIIKSIRRSFGVYFGPSTIYPFLNNLEEKGYIKSKWDLNNERPRKVYSLTPDGTSLLNGTEESLNHICNRLNRIGMTRLSFNNKSNVQNRTLNITPNISPK